MKKKFIPFFLLFCLTSLIIMRPLCAGDGFLCRQEWLDQKIEQLKHYDLAGLTISIIPPAKKGDQPIVTVHIMDKSGKTFIGRSDEGMILENDAELAAFRHALHDANNAQYKNEQEKFMRKIKVE